MTQEELQRLLLPAVLEEVPFEGLSERTLSVAAARIGLTPLDVTRAFPDGVRQVIDLWNAQADQAMADAFAAADTGSLKVRQKVTLAVRLRLEALAPHREAVRRTLAILALPGNHLLAARLLYRTLDEIWYVCGDRSADFNFYTKRGLLAAVYSATVMVWLDDDSEGFSQSWDFLDRRIVDAMKIPQLLAQIRHLPEKLLPPMLRRRPVRY